MSTLTLIVKDIATLKTALNKLDERKRLSSNERKTLTNFLTSLPPPERILYQKFPLNEHFEIKLLDIGEMGLHLNKWVELFNNLPNNKDEHLPHAWLIEIDENSNYWNENAIIAVAFIPSLRKSRKKGLERIVNIILKTDGNAKFIINCVEDAYDFPELYNFNGTWKEAYLLVLKTLQQGWPQTQFPKEFEQFLPKD